MDNKTGKKKLTSIRQEELLKILDARFAKNPQRHRNMQWKEVEAILRKKADKLWTINEMEITGGEPDVIELKNASNELCFYDCSLQTPKGRVSLCYDYEALDERKANKPRGNAMDYAKEMGVEILDEEHYRLLQGYGNFDTTTSSWIKTPSDIRKLGGALFADRRYNHVFVYHNGAGSYYAVRGFRAYISIL